MKHIIAFVALALAFGACGKKDPAPTPSETDTATAPAPVPDTASAAEAPDAAPAAQADTAEAPAPEADSAEASAAAEDVAAAPPATGPSPDTAVVVKDGQIVAVDAKTGEERVLAKPDGEIRSCMTDPGAGVVWAVIGPATEAAPDDGASDAGLDTADGGPLDGVAVFVDTRADEPKTVTFARGVADAIDVEYPDDVLGSSDAILIPVLKLSTAPKLQIVVNEPDDPDFDVEGIAGDEELMARKKALEAVKLEATDQLAALYDRARAAKGPRELPLRMVKEPFDLAREACLEAPLHCGFAARLPGGLWEVVVANDRGDFFHEMQQLYDPAEKRFVDAAEPATRSAKPFEEDGLVVGIPPLKLAASGVGWLVDNSLVMPARKEKRDYAMTCGWMGPAAVAGAGPMFVRDGAVLPPDLVPSADELPEGATLTRWGVVVTKEIAAAVAAPDRDEADKALDSGRHPAETLGYFRIAPGMKVAELGAGSGYTAELLARVVGAEGKVYGNNSPFILERFAEKPWTERLKKPVMKVVTRLDTPFDAPFPKDFEDMGKLDAVLIVLFYHDTVWQGVDRAAMNKAIYAALKPGGIYGIVDHAARPEDGAKVTKTLHRIDEDLVAREVREAGFTFSDQAGFLRNPDDPRDWNAAPGAAGDRRGTSDRFVLLFEKPGGDDEGDDY